MLVRRIIFVWIVEFLSFPFLSHSTARRREKKPFGFFKSPLPCVYHPSSKVFRKNEKKLHAWICWHLISCKKRKRRERNYHSLILLKKNVHFWFSFFLCLSNEHSGGGSPCHGETSLGLDKRSEMKSCQWLTRACSWPIFLGWSGGRWHCRWHCRWSGGRLGLNPGLRLPRIRNSRYTLVAQLDKAVMRLESVHSHFDFPGILLSISIFSPNHDWRADVFCSFDADYLDFLLERHHSIHHQRNEECIHESV